MRIETCARCGEPAESEDCVHIGLGVVMSAGEAERVRGRYWLGKFFNPAHDETSYRDPINYEEHN